jgi:DNA-binding NarL/FixJ family response regulator
MRKTVTIIGCDSWRRSSPIQQLSKAGFIDKLLSASIDTCTSSMSFFDRTDIVVVQIRDDLPRSWSLIKRLAARGNHLRCLAAKDDTDDRFWKHLVAINAWGHVREHDEHEAWIRKIRMVAQGRLAYPRNILDHIQTSGGDMVLNSKGD